MSRRLTKNEQTHMAKRMALVAEQLSNCDRTIGRLLHEAKDSAAKEERAHRALGRRMVGDIGTRLSVDYTAWLFVARAFFSADEQFSAPHSAADLARLREDYRMATMAREYAATRPYSYSSPERNMYAYACETFNVPPPGKTGQVYGVEGITAWDYSRDVAGN